MKKVVACLVAIPVAAAAGIEDYRVAAERIRTDNATKVAVTATITAEPHRARRTSIAEVRWAHDSAPGSATIIVPTASARGDRIPIWLDTNAAPTTPVTFFVGTAIGPTVARLGMTSCPCLSHDPGGG
ncbi:hypothetical protein PWJ90_35970, partial [Nocardia gipuzkoensis]|nr:hypothetical protein [Nocardia gipuzkoensis]